MEFLARLPSTTSLVTLAVFTFITASVLKIVLVRRKPLKLPPGPRPWPLLGNLPMFSDASVIHIQMKELAKIYGPVYTLWMGSFPTIVVSGVDAVREALLRNAANFSSRPDLYSWQFFSGGCRTSLSSKYEANWHKLRRILNTRVLSPDAIASYSGVRTNELRKVIQALEEEANSSTDRVVEPARVVRMAMSSILIRVCFGDEFDSQWQKQHAGQDSQGKLAQTMENFCGRIMEMGSVAHLGDYVPVMRHLPSSKALYKKYRALEDEVRNFVMPLIKRRRQMLSEAGGDFPPKCFMDILLSLDGDDELTDEDVLWNLMELVVGGTDTSGETTHWAMAYMVANPKVQTKLYEEIEGVVGHRQVTEADVEKMPYLRAFVKEVMRISTPAALGAPHATSTDCKLSGYDVPAGTQILFHAGALGNDERIWDSPSTLRPERFLVDLTDEQKLAFLPFGGGRRLCPGMNMGLLHMHLTLATVIREFEWSTAPDMTSVDLTQQLKFIVVLKTKLRATIKKRVNAP